MIHPSPRLTASADSEKGVVSQTPTPFRDKNAKKTGRGRGFPQLDKGPLRQTHDKHPVTGRDGHQLPPNPERDEEAHAGRRRRPPCCKVQPRQGTRREKEVKGIRIGKEIKEKKLSLLTVDTIMWTENLKESMHTEKRETELKFSNDPENGPTHADQLRFSAPAMSPRRRK